MKNSTQQEKIKKAFAEKIEEGMEPLEAFRWVQINVMGVKNPDRPKIYR
jgi:hypothetical protein